MQKRNSGTLRKYYTVKGYIMHVNKEMIHLHVWLFLSRKKVSIKERKQERKDARMKERMKENGDT